MTDEREPLFDAVRDAWANEPAPDFSAARRAVLNGAAPPTRRRGPWAVGAIAAAAAVLLVVWVTRPEPLSFVAGAAAGEAGPTYESADLAFSDGSTIDGEASVQVQELTPRGARVRLQRGTLRADITHREDTAWRFIAGPFEVQVIGTAFDLRWEPEAERFSIALREGEVEVRGPAIVRRVRAGEHFEHSLADEAAEQAESVEAAELVERAEPVEAADTSPETNEPVEPAETATRTDGIENGRADATRETRTRRARASAAREQAREAARLARAGEHRRAYDIASNVGWSQTLGLLGAADRLALGNAARVLRRRELAREAYEGAREGERGVRARAAFALGRLAIDLSSAPAEGARWFERAIQDDPRGPLAREAQGRLFEAYAAAGNARSAERAARAYLERYPSGPHAGRARSVLSP
ncbi:MAG: FecR domain-containing protein [Myxococcota bacterium]